MTKFSKELLIGGLWVAAGIVLLITTIETERLKDRVRNLEEQWIAHDSAGRLGTDSFWKRWRDADTIHMRTDDGDFSFPTDSVKLGGVIESNTTIKSKWTNATHPRPQTSKLLDEYTTWVIDDTMRTFPKATYALSVDSLGNIIEDTLPPVPILIGEDGRFIKLTPHPRKDTVDWKKVFGPITIDTTGFLKNSAITHFWYFSVYNENLDEVLSVDGDGVLHVKDSLNAIQTLIKTYKQLSDDYKR